MVKETGHEFIYGHTPATATPVDYALRENPDGSVSAIVGAMDLPSRTHWRVEIRLPADRAYFETNVLWYNPTPVEQPCYNWMTAAAFAREDLQVSIPGNAYLEHSGTRRSWPYDEAGRYLPLYRNNRFGGHKSYHVVGELNDFFGGYYAEADYGFGHWARYEDMPGQKLWLWALSRAGGVWEDLLTDTDGQYVEFQAGRLFVHGSNESKEPDGDSGGHGSGEGGSPEVIFPCAPPLYEDPLALVEGHGTMVVDSEGCEYLDFFSGILTLSIGHCHPEVVDRVREQVGRLGHTSTLYITENPIRAARRLSEIAPGRLSQTFFTSGRSRGSSRGVPPRSIGYCCSRKIITRCTRCCRAS